MRPFAVCSAGMAGAASVLEPIFPQLTVADAKGGILGVVHLVKVGVYHPGNAVVGYQQVGLVLGL